MPVRTHPARFTASILDAIEPTLRKWRLPVHDPFAGTGDRLGLLCDTLGLPFTGIELEPEFIVDHRVEEGNSTDQHSYPHDIDYCIVTSPVYPNGMADHFHAKDDSHRNTYRQALAAMNGYDRPLHVDNQGAYSIRRGLRAEWNYWRIAEQAVKWWPDRIIVNVKDFIIADEPYPLVAKWSELLTRFGYGQSNIYIQTPSNRFGANGNKRFDHEAVLIGTR